MLALSTSFISTVIADGHQIIADLEKYEIECVELDCRLNRSQFEQIKTELGASRLQIGSLHNYCPFPALKPGVPPGGDYFMLSSPESEERRLAVQWTCRTIENANDLEAGAVVLHCGAVQMQTRHENLYEMFRQGQFDTATFKEMLAMDLDMRERYKTPNLDALLFSLDQLLPVAEKHGVTLGLENRNHYFELPSKSELDLILNEFKGAPVGYWHDTGHAHVFEVLGIMAQQEMLDSFGQDLVGIHLHDARGLNDHLPPGAGEIDFNVLAPYFKENRPLVIELAPGTHRQDVTSSVSHIRALGGMGEVPKNTDIFSLT